MTTKDAAKIDNLMVNPMMTTLAFKKRIMIGTWNVRTLSEPSRLEQACREMDTYKLSVLGLSEVRWPKSGPPYETSSGFKLLFSGNDSNRINGVGILLTPKTSNCLIDYKPISDRIIVARLNSRFRKIAIIQCYAPTEPDDESVKDDFYSQLDATISSLPGGDIKILMGDFNPKVGNANAGIEAPLPTPSRRNQRRDIATHPPTRDEIKSALESLRNGKSSGPDNIPAELLKYGAPSLVDALFPIIRTAWTTSKIQDAWKEGVIITIPKQGDLKECKNWRGITLLNSIAKLMASQLLNRIRPAVESILRCEQAGFRTGRSCADHINTLRIIIEESKEYNAHLYLLFVDFERAFDTIRDALWEILSLNGIPDKIILLIRELYRNSTCRVRFNTAESSPFMTTAGVKQGCILSPTLFLLMLDFVMNKTNNEAPCGIQWNLNNRLNDIDYADDICLMAHRFEDIQKILNRLIINASSIGLKINIKKTKLMRIGISVTTPLTVNGINIEDVNTFCYLGSVISAHGGSEDDIVARINKARAAFQALHKTWRSNNISRKTKLRIFDSSVKSVLLYGSSTWGTTQSNMKKLQTFINGCLKRILHIFWPNVISTNELLTITNNIPVEEEIKKRKWTWIGHILRRPDNDITNWRNDGTDTLIDIGSGPGDVVSDCIYPRMPCEYQRLVFSDIKSSMVEFARQHYQHLPNSEFRLLNIESHDGLPHDLKGKFDHVTSNYCLHLAADQRQAYANIYNLLRPEGGDILLNTAPYASFFDALTGISYNEKWLPYIKDSELFTSALQNVEDPKRYMLDLLHSLGFRQCQVEIRDRVYIFRLEAFKDLTEAITPYIPRIPNHLLDDYLNDFVEVMSNLDPQCPLYNKNNNTVRLPYRQMKIYARKPSIM
ncbi:uncharacterized protein [Musca autumnalis]|uniref:uncharacterized protein n=1 Tax=Musca autumnalis TaxID=221902 RepID=UPI003CE66F35